MKNELRFISACFNINYHFRASGKIKRLAKKGLDWDFILKKLVQSDIAPLAFYNLSGLKDSKIPERFISSLNDIYNTTAIKNILIWKDLENTLNAFYSEKIPAIPLKGAFMVDVIYKDISPRPLSDIDILVKRSDLDKINGLMTKKEYIKTKEDPFTVTYAKKTVIMELHHRINLPEPVNMPREFMWKNAEEKKIRDFHVLYPSPEDALIYSALHFCHHLSDAILYLSPFPGLKSILDIHEIVSKKKTALDWGYITKISKKYGISSMVYSGLHLSKICFDTAMPPGCLGSIEPDFFKRKILGAFLLNEYQRLIDMDDKSKIGLFKSPYETNLVYSCLFNAGHPGSKLFSRPIKEFAEKHGLPHPSLKTFFLYLIRPFLFIKMLLSENRRPTKP